jgi:hypothetical protein
MIAFLVNIAAYFKENLRHIKKLVVICAIRTLGTDIRIASKNYTAILHTVLRAMANVHTGKNIEQTLYCLQVFCIKSKSGNKTEETYILGGLI